MVLFIGSVLFTYKDGQLLDSSGKVVAIGRLAFGRVKITPLSTQKLRIKVRIKSHQPKVGFNVILYQKKGLGFWPFGGKIFFFISDQPLLIPAF